MAGPASTAESSPPSVAPAAASDPFVTWKEFSARLRAFVARRAPAGIDPDDVVQEIFLRVVRHQPSLRDADRVEAWLFQIARNTLYDAMRSRRRRDSRTDALEIDVAASPDAEDVQAAEAELAPCLTPMVDRLAEPYRTAIQLTSLHGLTQTEAARRAGVSISGMKSRVQRARGQLKQMLLQCCQVDVDRRGGVADYLPKGTGCGTATNAGPSACGCGSGGCSPAS